MSATKRKATNAADANESPPRRRQRLEILSLNDLNDHCALEILRYLSVEELNSAIVFINSRYRELRNHDSLNQTRTGTIVCTDDTTADSVCRTFTDHAWDQVFTGNCTHMKVVGIERMRPIIAPFQIDEFSEHQLPNVSSLDISSNVVVGVGNQRDVCIHNVGAFLTMLPNLEAVNLSYMQLGIGSLCFIVQRYASRTLRKVTWNGSFLEVDLTGLAYDGEPLETPVAELVLDDSVLHTPFLYPEELFSVHGGGHFFMFQHCQGLERLSIKNATWSGHVNRDRRAVTQGMLIKMVRLHPTLRWLRSDLTEENIAMLRQERPDITFVSE